MEAMMKKLSVTALVLMMPVMMFAAPAAATVSAKALTSSAEAVSAPAQATPSAAAVMTTAAPAAIPAVSPAPLTAPVQAEPVSKTADAEANTNTANIEGLAPPSVDAGAYEEPNEPAPVADETAQEKNNHKENRKAKHFSIEQTLFTPSSIGTKLGYFINENWKAAAEYSTIASLIANSSKERNDTYAANICFSPADEDWSPFYGVGFTRLDMVMNATNSTTNDSLHVKRNIVGGYVTAGMNWITDSIFMFSVEFDLLGGYLRESDIDITNPAGTTQTNKPNIWANFGFTAGICF